MKIAQNSTLATLVMAMVLIIISRSGVTAQTIAVPPKKAESVGACVRVSLISNSNKLEKHQPILLTLRIDNTCVVAVKVAEPSFTIEKLNLDKKLKWGDRRVGRIIRSGASELDNSVKLIDSGHHLEINLDTNELRWMDSMSSIDVFEDLFTDLNLTAGTYCFYSTLTMKAIDIGAKEKSTQVVSNKIEFRFDRN